MKIFRHFNKSVLTKPVSPTRSGLAAMGLAAAVAASSVAMAQANTLYTITELPPLTTGSTGEAWALNNNGQVAGWSAADSSPGICQVVLWQAGSVTSLGVHNGNGVNGTGYGISDSGQVVGGAGYTSATLSSVSAFLWQNGTATTLDTLGGPSGACAINKNGQVVGFSFDSAGYRHAVLWQNGDITDLDVGSRSSSQAYGINNSGQIVGWSYSPYSNNEGMEPTLWQGGTGVSLGTLPHYVSGKARAINSTGQVVGWVSSVNNFQPYNQAFLSQNGVMTALPALSVGSSTYAYGINDSGQVVGNSGYRATLWQHDTVVNLNNVIPANSGWLLLNATAINDKGQIVGYGQFNGSGEGFLMTPTPEPKTLALLATAGVGLLLLKRRSNGAVHKNKRISAVGGLGWFLQPRVRSAANVRRHFLTSVS